MADDEMVYKVVMFLRITFIIAVNLVTCGTESHNLQSVLRTEFESTIVCLKHDSIANLLALYF